MIRYCQAPLEPSIFYPMAFLDFQFQPWQTFVLLGLFYVAGIGHMIHAVMHVRTAQGTIAWVMSLITIPFIAMPLYWLLGRNRFYKHICWRRENDSRLGLLAEEMQTHLQQFAVDIPEDDAFERAAQYLGGLPFTHGNELDLLIDGERAFERIFTKIQQAKSYLCINFYMVKNDRLGIKFQQALIDRARAGVKVYFLFDEIGSSKLSRKYLRELSEAGVEWQTFGTNRHWYSRFQLNFRNHRKVIVVDGETAFIGGLNVGDEYMGRDKHFGQWRDTHLELEGPVVQAVQLVFLSDWYWACDRVPELDWRARSMEANQIAAIIPTGPADPLDSWQLLVAEAANTARQRLWIASPYFVPDEGVLTALQAAAIRGVDVRILIPERADHWFVWLAAFTFLDQTVPFGVKIFRYQRGFLHQKVFLIDQRLAEVGSANLDNRSFRLNFEITAFSTDQKFIREVTEMLEIDFSHSIQVKPEDFSSRPMPFRLACRLARLLAPLL